MPIPIPAPAPYTASPSRKSMPIWVWILGGCGCMVFLPGLLGALLFPTFARARETARGLSCISNLKQSGTAMLLYAQDFDENYPAKGNWMHVITPYDKDESVFHCPSAAAEHLFTASSPHEAPFGYAYNSKLAGVNLSKVPAIGAVPMLYDSANLEDNASDAVASLCIPGRHLRGSADSRSAHQDAMAYGDGHAKFISPEQITTRGGSQK